MGPTNERTAPTEHSLVTDIISAPAGSPFSGPSGTYASLMARAILDASPRPGNFEKILAAFVEQRIEIALGDQAFDYFYTLEAFLRHRRFGLRPKKSSITRVMPEGRLDSLFTMLRSGLLADSASQTKGISTPSAKLEFLRKFRIGDTGLSWEYKVKMMIDGSILIQHATNAEVPAILAHLGALWSKSLTAAGPIVDRLAVVAEFEWWFIAPNITARCGAGLGDALSIALQRAVGIPLRRVFWHLDWEVLSRPLEEFIRWRVSMAVGGDSAPAVFEPEA